MHKGETVISAALALVVVLLFIALEQDWQPANLKDVASTAEEYILKATGIRGEPPDIVGYDKVKTYSLPLSYRAALYRSTATSLGLATGRFVTYDRSNHPLLELNTFEGLKDTWTQVYDFAGRNGLPDLSTGGRPVYTRELSGRGNPDLVVGQFSGGDQCCTVITVIELTRDSVQTLGRFEGLEGWPFHGLEIHRIKGPVWQLIAHRTYGTACGGGSDGADILTVYDIVNGQYVDRTSAFPDYLAGVLRRELAQWTREKARTVGLLQTITAEYVALGRDAEAQKFFESNSGPFLSQWKAAGASPQSCQQDLGGLAVQVASAKP
jgi:hypothetical protein